MADFKKALLIVLNFEGDYSNDTADRGGATRYGITETEARDFGYTGSMTELPATLAEAIYKTNYWNPNKGDAINNQSVATELFDISVNQGTGTAARFLQAALNYLNRPNSGRDDIPEDGAIGPVTVTAINNLSQSDSDALIKLLNIQQGARYIDIIKKDISQRVFIRGWIKRT